jgi:hypothetical protein
MDEEIYDEERGTKKLSGGNQGMGAVLGVLVAGANPGMD